MYNIYNLRPQMLLLPLLLLHLVAGSAQGSSNTSSWLTLSGKAPLVVARGGFSGLFPDSSLLAYKFVGAVSLPNTIVWCDVQITKDAVGICVPDLRLDNSSDIANIYPKKYTTYLVNGVSTKGWFSIDFTLDDLAKVSLTQGIYSRSQKFDGRPILAVEDVAGLKPPGLWLNIQYDAFFTQHKLSMRSYVLSVSRRVVVKYISSPEVNFLKSITSRFNPKVTKLIFRFLKQDDVEPTTNQTYGSLLTNLTFIKSFASGILVPKVYIWPLDDALYLQPHTSVVSDAHKEGLEVFAADIVNDSPFSYNYSYDPVAEYLSFVDNGDFSVDGVLSDFPITPSAAIGCYSHLGNNISGQAKPLVISHNGASGDFPGCTNLAYMKAINDGVDVIDCAVQMTKDGIAICLSSINLFKSTTVAQSSFSNRIQNIPELGGDGIYTFDLTWSEIQSLKAQILNPFSRFQLFRNPRNRNEGTFVTLTDFIALATNTSSISGVLISIENAAYLAEKQGMGVIDSVLDILSKNGHDNKTAQKIMIQSTNSSVLVKLKAKSNYELVYHIDEDIGDALNSTIEDIKTFAHSVILEKKSIYSTSEAFITSVTSVVQKFHLYELPVYVQIFRNEFVSQAWDFFSDATVEINSFVKLGEIDGVITEFPKTAVSYRNNRCLNSKNIPPYMLPVQGGSLMSLINPQSLQLAEDPALVLTDAYVDEAPLLAVTDKVNPDGSGAPVSSLPNDQPIISSILSPVLVYAARVFSTFITLIYR